MAKIEAAEKRRLPGAEKARRTEQVAIEAEPVGAVESSAPAQDAEAKTTNDPVV